MGGGEEEEGVRRRRVEGEEKNRSRRKKRKGEGWLVQLSNNGLAFSTLLLVSLSLSLFSSVPPSLSLSPPFPPSSAGQFNNTVDHVTDHVIQSRSVFGLHIEGRYLLQGLQQRRRVHGRLGGSRGGRGRTPGGHYELRMGRWSVGRGWPVAGHAWRRGLEAGVDHGHGSRVPALLQHGEVGCGRGGGDEVERHAERVWLWGRGLAGRHAHVAARRGAVAARRG